MYDTHYLPCVVVAIHSQNIEALPQHVYDNNTPSYVIIDVQSQATLLSVLWFRKLRAHLALYNKSIIGALNPGIHLENLKSASIAIIHKTSLSIGPEPVVETPLPVTPSIPTASDTLIHHGHLRGGQSIHNPEGDLIVLGNIHHGAEVTAGGHIHVCGALQGRALCGTKIGSKAIITAFSLDAELVSVDGYYLANDEITKYDKPVCIQLHGENITIH